MHIKNIINKQTKNQQKKNYKVSILNPTHIPKTNKNHEKKLKTKKQNWVLKHLA